MPRDLLPRPKVGEKGRPLRLRQRRLSPRRRRSVPLVCATRAAALPRCRAVDTSTVLPLAVAALPGLYRGTTDWSMTQREHAMHHTTGPMTRRSFVQGGLLASLALIAARGALPIHDVAAEKKTKKKPRSAQSHNQNQKDYCEIGGGTLEATPIGGGTWETKCHGGDSDGRECTNTAKSAVCVQTRTDPDLPGHPLEPDPPFADPGDTPDHPLEPDSPVADPGDAPDHPLEPDAPIADPGDAPTHPLEPDGGGVTITAYGGKQHRRAKHHSKHHGRGKRRQT
jgi:hypothetical protein